MRTATLQSGVELLGGGHPSTVAHRRCADARVLRVKLRWPDAVVLFLLGAVASLIGDHSHVATGTTEYLSYAVPFVWSSPIWFPLLVALATVSLAELRLHMPALRTSVTARQGLAGVAAVVGIYVTTALVHTAPPVPANALIYALAVITWCALGDRWGAICGLLAAVDRSRGRGRRRRGGIGSLRRRFRRAVRRRAMAARAVLRVRGGRGAAGRGRAR